MGDIINSYTKKLQAYLDQNPMQYTEGDTLLEQLHWCYAEANSVDSPALRKAFRELYCSMPELSAEKFDEIFSMVSTLSVLQEQLAFKAGVKVGFRLAAELLES